MFSKDALKQRILDRIIDKNISTVCSKITQDYDIELTGNENYKELQEIYGANRIYFTKADANEVSDNPKERASLDLSISNRVIFYTSSILYYCNFFSDSSIFFGAILKLSDGYIFCEVKQSNSRMMAQDNNYSINLKYYNNDTSKLFDKHVTFTGFSSLFDGLDSVGILPDKEQYLNKELGRFDLSYEEAIDITLERLNDIKNHQSFKEYDSQIILKK